MTRTIPLLLLSVALVGGCGASRPVLTAAISPDIPPYVIDGAKSGIQVDILREALPGYDIRFTQMPYDDIQSSVARKGVDIEVSVRREKDGVFHSDDFVTFRNVAVSRKSAGLKIDKVADLAGKKVVSWQGAWKELGPEFEALYAPNAPQRANYKEPAAQREHVAMLKRGEVDAVVIDRDIFNHFRDGVGLAADDVVFHAIFAKTTSFAIGCKDAGVRDEFNRRLAEMRRDGTYAKILARYREKVDPQ